MISGEVFCIAGLSFSSMLRSFSVANCFIRVGSCSIPAAVTALERDEIRYVESKFEIMY